MINIKGKHVKYNTDNFTYRSFQKIAKGNKNFRQTGT